MAPNDVPLFSIQIVTSFVDGRFRADLLSLEEGVWRLGAGELRRVKQLEEENRKLKQLVADLSLDRHILQDVLAKQALTPGQRG